MNSEDASIVKARAVKGVLALTSRTLFLQLISLISFSLLSASLSPAAIGVYVAVTAIMRIVNFFTDFGLGAAIVQKKDNVTQDDLSTAFTIQVLITLLIFAIFFALRNYISSYFHLSTEGLLLLLVLIFTLFLSSFKTIPSVMLERNLHFSRVVIPQIAESLVFNILIVILAYRGLGVSSYTWSTLIASIIGIPFYYLVSPWKIKLGFSLSSMKVLLYGTAFQAKSILGTIKDDLLTTFLIKLLPFSQIGLIGWGQRWSFFSFRFFVDSVTKVTFSAYSRLQHDSSLLKSTIEKSLFATSLTMFPILAGLMLTSSYFIRFIPQYNKWEGAIFSLYFFCLNAAVSSLSNILVNVLDATGNIKTTLKLMVMWTLLTWTITPFFIYLFGYNGVAAASFIVTLTIFITVYLVKQIVKFDFFKSIYQPVVATMGMSVIVYIFNRFAVTNLFMLSGSILLGLIAYSAIIMLMAKKEIIEFVQLFKKSYK